MKKLLVLLITGLWAGIVFAGGPGQGAPAGHGHHWNPTNDNLAAYVESILPGEIDQTEEDMLLYLIEEEKLARDVYLELGQTWGLRIFENIAASEQTHMNAVEMLLNRYQIANPTAGQPVGSFVNVDLADLYDELTAMGVQSIIDALNVGATIEDMDIKDLLCDLEVTDNEDIQTVLQNLMKGSRNHLRAFVSLLERNQETYIAQYLPQEDVDAILASEKETGMVDAQGDPVLAAAPDSAADDGENFAPGPAPLSGNGIPDGSGLDSPFGPKK